MSKHDFGYFFHEGLSNMFSHGFMSFAAIGITVACLLIMGTFTLVAVNADANLKQAEQDNEILAFVDDSYTEAQAKALQKKLEAVDNVASVTFISREEAMQSFISEHPDEEYFQDLDPNILRDRFAIKVKELKLQSQTVELIKAIPGIGGINAYAELTNGFITVRNIATVICLTLIAVLFVVSMFIISNTIKLTTFDRCMRASCWALPVRFLPFCCNGACMKPLRRALPTMTPYSSFPSCPSSSFGSRWAVYFWGPVSSLA